MYFFSLFWMDTLFISFSPTCKMLEYRFSFKKYIENLLKLGLKTFFDLNIILFIRQTWNQTWVMDALNKWHPRALNIWGENIHYNRIWSVAIILQNDLTFRSILAANWKFAAKSQVSHHWGNLPSTKYFQYYTAT